MRTRNAAAALHGIPRTSLARFLADGGAPSQLRQEAGARQAFEVAADADLYLEILVAIRALGGRSDDALPVCAYLRSLSADERPLAVGEGMLVNWVANRTRKRFTFYRSAAEIPIVPGMEPAEVVPLVDAIASCKANR